MEITLKITKKHLLFFTIIVAAIIIVAIVSVVILSSNSETSSPKKISEGLEYEFYSSYNGYAVSGIGTCTDRNIVIPEEYNNYPVVLIDSEAFRECETIDSVYMPDSITGIGKWAFIRCINLTEIRFSENLEGIGESAFWECIKLKEICIPDKCTSIQNGAFSYCSDLNRVEFSKGIKQIGMEIFYQSKNVEIYYSGTIYDWWSIDIQEDPYGYIYQKRIINVHLNDNTTLEWKVRN